MRSELAGPENEDEQEQEKEQEKETEDEKVQEDERAEQAGMPAIRPRSRPDCV